MDIDEPNAACAATTDESHKRTQRTQKHDFFSLRSLRSLAANSLPRKQRFACTDTGKARHSVRAVVCLGAGGGQRNACPANFLIRVHPWLSVVKIK
jgi:hypothetical protein